jgi:(E)-4-hydroxy-3-methylbut-2-enyl-diphosphate synthase
LAKAPLPLIADVHFSVDRALEAIEAGVPKIRLNPGNIKNKKDLSRIISAAKSNETAIRIGVNEASIRNLKQGDIPPEKRVPLMVRELSEYVKFFEKNGFENLVLSAKSVSAVRTIEVNRLISKTFDYPIHVGLTHAGLPEDATVSSAAAIGTLLAEGIGDTIRVSLAGDPVREIELGYKLLESLELKPRTGPELVVCPTCGRCEIDVVKLAKSVKKALSKVQKPARIAVMGCVVNGPGEAADADLAVCAAKGRGFLYKHGRKIASVPEQELIENLQKCVENL